MYINIYIPPDRVRWGHGQLCALCFPCKRRPPTHPSRENARSQGEGRPCKRGNRGRKGARQHGYSATEERQACGGAETERRGSPAEGQRQRRRRGRGRGGGGGGAEEEEEGQRQRRRGGGELALVGRRKCGQCAGCGSIVPHYPPSSTPPSPPVTPRAVRGIRAAAE